MQVIRLNIRRTPLEPRFAGQPSLPTTSGRSTEGGLYLTGIREASRVDGSQPFRIVFR